MINQVDKNLITDLNKEAVVKKIEKYFSLSLKQRKILSLKSRKVAKKYNEKDMLKNFVVQFEKLLLQIQKR